MHSGRLVDDTLGDTPRYGVVQAFCGVNRLPASLGLGSMTGSEDFQRANPVIPRSIHILARQSEAIVPRVIKGPSQVTEGLRQIACVVERSIEALRDHHRRNRVIVTIVSQKVAIVVLFAVARVFVSLKAPKVAFTALIPEHGHGERSVDAVTVPVEHHSLDIVVMADD